MNTPTNELTNELLQGDLVDRLQWFNWANPMAFMALWLVPALLFILWWAERRRRQRLAVFGSSAAPQAALYRNRQPVVLDRARQTYKIALIVLAALAMIVALARPQWGFEWAEVRRRGLDVVVAVDVSRSMAATDINPSRLARAKREIIDLINVARGDRLALVAFAGSAFVQCPLTLDYGALRMFMDYLDSDLIPLQGTNIGEALRASREALAAGGDAAPGGQAIILMTDGESLSGDVAGEIDALKKAGVRVFTIGLGSPEGAPVPEADGGYKKDAAGNLVLSKLAESSLQHIAQELGGYYVRAAGAQSAIEPIYQQGIRAQTEERDQESTREKQWFERFQILIALALLLLTIEVLVTDIVAARGKSLVLVLLAFGVGLMPMEGRAETPEPATPPGSNHLQTYNEAVRSFRNDDVNRAREGFRAATSGEKLGNDAWYNLGLAEAKLKDYAGAVAAWEKALELRQNDQQVKDNLEWARRKLAEQQKKEQKNEEKQDQKDQQKSQKQQEQEKQQEQQKEEQQEQRKEQQQEPEQQQEQQKQPKQQQEQQSEQQNGQKQQESPMPEPTSASESEPTAMDAKKMDKQDAARLLQSVEEMSRRDALLREAKRRGMKVPNPGGQDW